MGAIDTNYTFTATDVITSTKMNNILEQSTITPTAIFNETLSVTSGKLLVKAGGITSNELGSNSVTTNSITDLNVTTGKLADSSVTLSKMATDSVGSNQIVDASITAPMLDGLQSGAAPIYGCRAWVNFDGSVVGTFAGGASTVTRIAGSTTATITTTTDHKLITNNVVQVITGVTAGSYSVTVTGLKTFTVTTASTTALSNVAITFMFRQIRSAGNVNSIARKAAGEYYVNFSIPMANANYCSIASFGAPTGIDLRDWWVVTSPYEEAQFPERTSMSTYKYEQAGTANGIDLNNVNVSIFG